MPADHSKAPSVSPSIANRLDAISVAALLALFALVVTALAWAHPATTSSSIAYQQAGQLSYTAPTAPSSVYGGSPVATGQPVYTNAVNDLTVGYTYHLSSPLPAKVGGTEQLVATIDNGQGVVRSFDLQPATHFSGADFRALGTLHLSDLQTAASAFEQMATVDGAAAYVVSVTPNVDLNGRFAGQTLRTGFNQPVKFNYRPSTSVGSGVFSLIHPAGPPAASNSSGSSSATVTGPVTLTAKGAVVLPGGRPADLFLGLPVDVARIGAPIALVIALFALFVTGRAVLGELTARDERRRISARHGAAMVEVTSLPPASSSTVELSSFDGLLKVARRLGCPLLHVAGRASVYAVVDGGTVYRYVVDDDLPAGSTLVTPGPTAIIEPATNGHLVQHRN